MVERQRRGQGDQRQVSPCPMVREEGHLAGWAGSRRCGSGAWARKGERGVAGVDGDIPCTPGTGRRRGCAAWEGPTSSCSPNL